MSVTQPKKAKKKPAKKKAKKEPEKEHVEKLCPHGIDISDDGFGTGEGQCNENPLCNDHDPDGRCCNCGQHDCYECDWGEDDEVDEERCELVTVTVELM